MGDGAVVAWDIGPIKAHAGRGSHHPTDTVAGVFPAFHASSPRTPGVVGAVPAVRARMGRMSDVVKHGSGDVDVRKARILLYSDDRNVREKVRFAVGPTTHGRPIEWVETATHAAVIDQLDGKPFDLVILDGEAAKVGGMGIARQMRAEMYTCPPILLLVGRPGDAWLATWSEADAAVAHPLDPFAVRESVDAFFAPAQADA